jgi:predicted TIM-barrel fold metal-dependent hydrolase
VIDFGEDRAMTIDMHAHWSPPELIDIYRARTEPPMIYTDGSGNDIIKTRRGEQAFGDMFDDLETRLAEMDEHGVATGVLSLWGPHQWIERLPVEESVPAVRIFNDAVSQVCAGNPGRFVAYASLPLADMDAAVAELDRVMALPGMIGAILPGNAFMTLADVDAYRPILAAANRHKAALFIHWGPRPGDEWPRTGMQTDNFIRRMGTLDMQASLSACTVTLTMTDLLDDYPDARFHIHNLGGNVAFEVERLDHRSLLDTPDEPLPSTRLTKPNLWFDCNSFGAKSIDMAVDLFGVDRIVYATDGTAFGCDWTNKALAETSLTDDERDMIRSGNARAMMGHLAPFASMAQAAE